MPLEACQSLQESREFITEETEGPGGVPCLPSGLAASGHEREKGRVPSDLLGVVNIGSTCLS